MLEEKKQMEFSMSKVNDRALRIARKDLKNFEQFIQKIMEENEFSSVEEATKYIESRYYNIFFVNKGISVDKGNLNVKTDTTRSDFFLLKTAQSVKNHPEKIWEVLDRMTPEDRKKLFPTEEPFLRYTPDMEANYKMALKDISRYILEYLKIDRSKFIDGSLSYEERSKFQKSALLLLGEATVSINNKLRDSCVRRITSMAKLLDEHGEFEIGTSRYNDLMRKIGLEELKVDYEKSKKGNKPQFTTMKDLENPKVVEKLPFDVQIGMSVFLTNRLAKIFSSYKKAKFILEQKDELESVVSSKVKISDDELKCILGKFDYLQGLLRTLYSETSAAVHKDYQEADKATPESIFNKRIKIDTGNVENGYKDFFDAINPNLDNDFGNNLDSYNSSNTIFEGIYERKDFDFHALIPTLLDKESSRINWGYIPEEEENKNSIQRNKRMILMGIDFEGFNFPIRVHCSRNDLLNLVKEYTGKDEIPVYRGEEDWKVETQYDEAFDMTAQVVVPFDKYKRKFVTQKVKNLTPDERNSDYLLHLNWMINPSQVPSKRKEKTVVSLETGEIMPENQRTL